MDASALLDTQIKYFKSEKACISECQPLVYMCLGPDYHSHFLFNFSFFGSEQFVMLHKETFFLKLMNVKTFFLCESAQKQLCTIEVRHPTGTGLAYF